MIAYLLLALLASPILGVPVVLVASESATVEGVALEFAKNCPIAAAIILVIVLFIKHLDKLQETYIAREERREKIDEERAETLKTLGDTCHSFQREMAANNERVMQVVAKALTDNSAALAVNTRALDEAGRR